MANLNWKHWVIVLGGLLVIAGPDLAKVLGLFDVGNAATIGADVAGFGTLLLALFAPSPTQDKRPPVVPPVALLCLALGMCVPGGCGKGPVIAAGVADVTLCVLEHSTEPPEQIASECAGITVADVIRILQAHKAAELREASQPKDAGAAVGK